MNPNWSVKEMLLDPAKEQGFTEEEAVTQATIKISQAFVNELKKNKVKVDDGEGLDVLYFSKADAMAVCFRGKFLLVNLNHERLDKGLDPWQFVPVTDKSISSQMSEAFSRFKASKSQGGVDPVGIFDRPARKEYLN